MLRSVHPAVINTSHWRVPQGNGGVEQAERSSRVVLGLVGRRRGRA